MSKFRGFKKTFDPRTGERKPDSIATEVSKTIEQLMTITTPSSGQKAHQIGTEKLIAAGFDPLDRLMEQLEEIERLIKAEQTSTAPRANFIDKLLAMKLRILETILPYKYGKAPIVTVQDNNYQEPIKIVLDLNDSAESEKDDNEQ